MSPQNHRPTWRDDLAIGFHDLSWAAGVLDGAATIRVILGADGKWRGYLQARVPDVVAAKLVDILGGVTSERRYAWYVPAADQARIVRRLLRGPWLVAKAEDARKLLAFRMTQPQGKQPFAWKLPRAVSEWRAELTMHDMAR